MNISPDNTIFVVLSFEGPDAYSMAGALGARIAYLTQALARMGFELHHFFIGDPHMSGVESREEGRLTLHRWCQWISWKGVTAHLEYNKPNRISKDKICLSFRKERREV
jgi:hypothetical protein